ncbi:hypothetical protein HanOQP8_Chr17g0644831 [Helianthus annuus]|nr:hypothetical protein HanLR1_Chr17g0649361 [Helianthus annuus]KAJ0634881.1 hypothetical protein HanOQP8_Chr17g0644831 [Helianthus annuus]
MATQQTHKDLFSSYLGISFTIFLHLLPKHSLSLIPSLQTHNKSLTKKLLQAEQQLDQLYSRRKEDSKANARVVEIFASHRHSWQQEEKRLLRQIDDNLEEIADLRAKVEDLEVRVDELKREVSERDELLNFITNRVDDDDGISDNYKVKCNGVVGDYYMERGFHNVDDLGSVYDGGYKFGPSEFSGSGVSKFLAERSNLWQVCLILIEVYMYVLHYVCFLYKIVILVCVNYLLMRLKTVQTSYWFSI